jgi:hypothetical protein
MTLTDFANIGEAIGGLAVIATLIYLIFEVRDNTRILKANATTAAFIGWSEFNVMLSKHPNLAVIMRAFDPKESYENFEIDDLATLDTIGRAMLQRFTAGSFQYNAGIRDPETHVQEITYCKSFLSLPFWHAWWEIEKRNPIYAKLFLSEIESAPYVPVNIGGLDRHHDNRASNQQ